MDKDEIKPTEHQTTDSKKDNPARKEKRIITRTYERNDSGNIVWGVVLILAGLTLLLNNLGLVSSMIWSVLWGFWPILLILAGVRILVGNNLIGNVIMTIISVILLGSIWIRALIEVNSPIIYMWGLDSLPWVGWLRNLNLERFNF